MTYKVGDKVKFKTYDINYREWLKGIGTITQIEKMTIPQSYYVECSKYDNKILCWHNEIKLVKPFNKDILVYVGICILTIVLVLGIVFGIASVLKLMGVNVSLHQLTV